jgi:protein-S-isoprenylcysteine O-methyltransferase Ste14
MNWLNFLAAEASAILGLVVFIHLSKYRPRDNEEVIFPQKLGQIRLGFKLVLVLLFHQLIFALWGFRVFGFPVTSNWTQNVSQAGAVLSLVGLALYLWSRVVLKNHLLPPMSVAVQRQTTFVTTGPFGFSRNPMYLSWLLIFTGVQLLTLSLLVFFSPFLMRTLHQWVLQEEVDRLKLHGESYKHYLMTTSRWISILDLTHVVRKSLYLE